ncbi:MAG: twin-arginine translocase TatA/TatE family subunit [Bdellovibrionales bacterium]
MSPSFWQIVIVVVIVLFVFGPKRIPGLGKSLGEAIRGFRKGLNEDEPKDEDNKNNNSSES